MNIPVAFYARVSTEEQAERGNIQTQIDYARKFFDLHGVADYEVYADEGVSGTVPLPERPEGARLLADIQAGRRKEVYVYRVDRLARSTKIVLDTCEFLERRNVPLKSMTEPFDTGTAVGKCFLTLVASFAALERDTIVERTQGGKARKAKEGRWVSGPPPFGYRIGDDGSLVIHEEEAETVRLIFRLYLEGHTTIDIAKYLNARGIPTPARSKRTKNPSTGRWHAGHVSIILRTEAYAGEYRYLRRSKRKKETIPMPVAPLVDAETFRSAQARLAANADAARGRRGRSYLLRGLIFCGHCGRQMVGSSGDSKSGRVYYRCTGTVDQGAGRRCEAKQIRAMDVEQAIIADIEEFLRNPGQVELMIQEQLDRQKEDIKPVDDELAQVEQAIADKQAGRARVVSLCARGLVTDKEAEAELQALAQEIEALKARRDHLFARQVAARETETRALNVRLMLERLASQLDSLEDETKADLVRALVRRIDVYTEIGADGKRNSRAVVQYMFDAPEERNRGMVLSNSANSQNNTTVSVQTAWRFATFSRRGGVRISPACWRTRSHKARRSRPE